MGFANSYLDKHVFSLLDIPRAPSGLLRYIVVIPAFQEPDIFKTLHSLTRCTIPEFHTEVYILINFPPTVSPEVKKENLKIYNLIKDWCQAQGYQHINFFVFLAEELPDKHAGAGLARKILMDAATFRFNQIDCEQGLIISLDADTLVPADYLIQIENQHQNTRATCLIFNFAHPTSGGDFPPALYDAIILYELHLRYYKFMLWSTGFPFYNYTIGSCFAVQTKSYIKVGGMNRRQAGEDFYFLHKIFPHNKVSFINKLIVEPSPRISDRVPFGTGPTIKRMVDNHESSYKTYNPKAFLELKEFFPIAYNLYKADKSDMEKIIGTLPNCLNSFLKGINATDKIEEIKRNCANESSFNKRFYLWFDGFMIVKFLNYAREKQFPPIDILEAAKMYLNSVGIQTDNSTSPLEFLIKFRKLDFGNEIIK